jgi:thiol:disulfide interchange protein DsbD
MALNFLGVFELGTSVMNIAGRSQTTNAFATGALSVFVAAPCTGPFMGTALGAAAVLPALQAMSIFVFLGLGLAFPFLVLAFSPRLVRILPKPGAWMETLKHFFAFPLLATVLWLLWVLGLQTGTDGWLYSAIALLAISFAIWLGKSRPFFVKSFAWLFALLVLAFSYQQILLAKNNKIKSSSTTSAGPWVPFDKGKIAAARAAHNPVFVDFTAAWCITCQVNKKTVLETEAALSVFKAHNVLLMVGDWTNPDPIITDALAEFGRKSVPVYAFYPADGSAAKILPQILSQTIIEDLFKEGK